MKKNLYLGINKDISCLIIFLFLQMGHVNASSHYDFKSNGIFYAIKSNTEVIVTSEGDLKKGI